ncbi:MAG: hypothetical protein R3B06_21240 [Kofleriaceae bacterium]
MTMTPAARDRFTDAADALVALARLPSGALPDDIALVLVRAAARRDARR